MLAIVCPGQGSQTPGFLTEWLRDDAVAAQFSALAEQCGVDLVTHGTVSDEETIKDTAIAQPLIVAAGLLSAEALGVDEIDRNKVIFAGHSVGEITAAALAGVLSNEDALRFVRTRAEGMAAAAAETPTGMSAVLGGDAESLQARLSELGLSPANVNGGGQVVVAGALDALAELAANPPAKARVIPLKVAGAFHTEYMASAMPGLRAVAETITPATANARLLSNQRGQLVDDGDTVLATLLSQLTSPVRWDLCMESLVEHGVTGVLELCPAGTLVGLAKRGMRGVKTFALKTPEQLDDARAFIAEHTA